MMRAMRVVMVGFFVLAGGAVAGETEGPRDLGSLIDDLRDDEVRWNAIAAMDAILLADASPVGMLQQALESGDRQQRQLAGFLLRRIIRRATPFWYSDQSVEDLVRDGRLPSWWLDPKPDVTEALLRVSVEALSADDMPYQRRGNVMVYNAASAVPFLVEHVEAARSLLVEAAAGDGRQARWLAAWCLGTGGVSDEAGLVCAIMIPHLRDNEIEGDAVHACAAIYRLGPAAVPYLREALADADEQQRALIELLVRDIEAPPRTREDLEKRGRLQEITGVVHDPAVEVGEGGAFIDVLRPFWGASGGAVRRR